jgi:hypothetical protein
MDLSKRDTGIQHLQKLIDQRKKSLYETQKSLNTKSKDNIYLREIAKDYVNLSALENQQQYKALQLLAEYLTQITLDPTSTEEMLRNCKYDRSIISAEMKRLNI